MVAAGEQLAEEPWIAARNAAVLTLLYGSGLRISEALGLTSAAFGGDRDAVGHEDKTFRRIGRVDSEHVFGPEVGEPRLCLDDEERNHALFPLRGLM